MDNRYSRNIPALSEADMEKLNKSRVLVAGCGGLGGYVIEYLARAGIGALTVVDGDTFDESNLNRQILCTAENIGKLKVPAAAERVRAIDPGIDVRAVCEKLTKENASALMADADIVIDCLDSIESRLILENAAADAGLYMVHGAISGWELQAMLVSPGSGLLRGLYADAPEDSVKTSLSFTPAACAALEVSLAVSALCGHGTTPEGTLITGSLRDIEFHKIKI